MIERKYPQRTCIGCRETKDKKELIRIVHTPDGQFLLDPGGKLNGRGAYVCPDPACLQKAVKGGNLSRSLRTQVPAETAARLYEEMKAFVAE
ncbi:MAG: YlxR family protein [Lachnospiraceae bacterium]|nr:YlxR family protein [Lachnospiraceae bacterium]